MPARVQSAVSSVALITIAASEQNLSELASTDVTLLARFTATAPPKESNPDFTVTSAEAPQVCAVEIPSSVI